MSKLFINPICPFAQRAMIVAAHKAAPVEEVHVSLAAMPEAFIRDINPRATVPAIQLASGAAYPESMLIAQYLDETTEPRNALLPANAEARAQIRAFIDAAMPAAWACYGYLQAAPEDLAEKAPGVRAALGAAAAALSATGPYALGAQFTMADVAFAPFLLRFVSTVKAYCGLDIAAEFPRLGAYVRAVLLVPSVAATTETPEYFIDAYESYGAPKKPRWAYTLYGAAECPFCERVYLTAARALAASPGNRRGFEVATLVKETVDLAAIPEWFVRDLNPAGEVPVLVTPWGTKVIGSFDICQFLAEAFPAAELEPADAAQRLHGRFFVDSLGALVDAAGPAVMAHVAVAGDLPEAAVAAGRALEALLARFGGPDGPYVTGARATIYDFAAAPLLHRTQLVFGARFDAALPRLAALLAAVRADPLTGPALVPAAAFLKA